MISSGIVILDAVILAVETVDAIEGYSDPVPDRRIGNHPVHGPAQIKALDAHVARCIIDPQPRRIIPLRVAVGFGPWHVQISRLVQIVVPPVTHDPAAPLTRNVAILRPLGSHRDSCRETRAGPRPCQLRRYSC